LKVVHAQLKALSATIADRDARLDKATRQLAIVKRSRAFRIASAALPMPSATATRAHPRDPTRRPPSANRT
jgi:hypothetical protein